MAKLKVYCTECPDPFFPEEEEHIHTWRCNIAYHEGICEDCTRRGVRKMREVYRLNRIHARPSPLPALPPGREVPLPGIRLEEKERKR